MNKNQFDKVVSLLTDIFDQDNPGEKAEKENKKYELTGERIEVDRRVLHRIKALRSFGDVKAGDLGGFVESENNLSHEGDAWIAGDAEVYGNGTVSDHG